jgi:hypothetical protein
MMDIASLSIQRIRISRCGWIIQRMKLNHHHYLSMEIFANSTSLKYVCAIVDYIGDFTVNANKEFFRFPAVIEEFGREKYWHPLLKQSDIVGLTCFHLGRSGLKWDWKAEQNNRGQKLQEIMAGDTDKVVHFDKIIGEGGDMYLFLSFGVRMVLIVSRIMVNAWKLHSVPIPHPHDPGWIKVVNYWRSDVDYKTLDSDMNKAK